METTTVQGKEGITTTSLGKDLEKGATITTTSLSNTTQVQQKCRETSTAVSSTVVVDNPCWGSPDQCSLADLLSTLDKKSTIVHESVDYIVLHKPPDLRMDGEYPATVHKLLTYWYPPPSIQTIHDDNDNCSTESLLHNRLQRVASLSTFNSLSDNELRPCHQLDYATSGVLLMARSKQAAAKACGAFADRTTEKTYLAILHGHLDTREAKTIGTCSTLQQLKAGLVGQEKSELQQESKRRKDTFDGFQPPHSIFEKWKARRRTEQQQQKAMISSDAVTQQDEPKRRHKRKRKDIVDVPHVWQHIGSRLSEQDKETLSGMLWKEAMKLPRKQEWKAVFEDASVQYNEALQKHRLAARQGQQDESTRNNDRTAFALHQMPTTFVLEDDDDPDTLYINAALAPQKDSFAMQIYTARTTRPTVEKETPDTNHTTTTTTTVLPAPFKHALTRCTVLQRGVFRTFTKTNNNESSNQDGNDDPVLYPITKVRLEPMTGRRHQLRCHTALLGHPILGDATYQTKNVGCTRMCLHAKELRLPNGMPHASTEDPFVFNDTGELVL